MAIYPDKKAGELTGRFRVEVQTKGRRLRGRFDSLSEAKQAERDFRGRLAAGEGRAKADNRPSQSSWQKAIDLGIEQLWRSSPTQAALARRAVYGLARMSEKGLPLATLPQEYSVDLEARGSAPGTINRHLSVIHSYLSWCKVRGIIDEVPAMPWRKEKEGRLRWLSHAEEEALLDQLDRMQPAVADFVRVAIQTGMRRGELLALQPDQIQGGWAHLTKTKSGKRRSVPLSPRTVEILAHRLPWAIREHDLRYWWKRAQRAIGLADDREFTLHACRHTTATRLIQANVNVRVVQRYLGHEDIKTTLRYAHVADGDLQTAMEAL